jgi:hypothetical protein
VIKRVIKIFRWKIKERKKCTGKVFFKNKKTQHNQQLRQKKVIATMTCDYPQIRPKPLRPGGIKSNRCQIIV